MSRSHVVKRYEQKKTRGFLSLILCVLILLPAMGVWGEPIGTGEGWFELVDNIFDIDSDFTQKSLQIALDVKDGLDKSRLQDVSVQFKKLRYGKDFPLVRKTTQSGSVDPLAGDFVADFGEYAVRNETLKGAYKVPIIIKYKIAGEEGERSQEFDFYIRVDGDSTIIDLSPPEEAETSDAPVVTADTGEIEDSSGPGNASPDLPPLPDPVNRQSILMVKEGGVPRLELGQEIDLILPIVNRGDQFVRIVNVTPQVGLDDSYPFEITQSDYTQQVETLLAPQGALGRGYTAAGIDTAVNFGKVWVKQDLKKGYYKVDFLVRYQDFITKKENMLYPCPNDPSQVCTQEGYVVDLPPEYAEVTLSLIFYVNGVGEETDDGKDVPIPTPRLIVTGFTTTPEQVQGGDDFTLRMMLHNASSITAVQNVRLTFDSGEGTPFLPKDGASTMHIESIPAGGDYEVLLLLQASPTLEEKIYPMNIRMEYEDYEAKPYEANETLSIPIRQETRVSIGQVEMWPDTFMTGEEASLNFAIYNKGKSQLFNVTVTIPEGEAASGDEIYLGNVEPGSSRDVDMMIRGEQETPPEGGDVRIEINYEDANGASHTIEETIEMTIMGGGDMMDEEWPEGMPPEGFGEEMPYPDGMGPEGQGGRKLPLWAWILIILAVIIAVFTLISKLLKRRKARKRAEEDAAFFKKLEEERQRRNGGGGGGANPQMRRRGPRQPRQRR